eukprot:COSAG01_NODE_2708_length_7219_cov_2.933146_14_plen_53_part_00
MVMMMTMLLLLLLLMMMNQCAARTHGGAKETPVHLRARQQLARLAGAVALPR